MDCVELVQAERVRATSFGTVPITVVHLPTVLALVTVIASSSLS